MRMGNRFDMARVRTVERLRCGGTDWCIQESFHTSNGRWQAWQ